MAEAKKKNSNLRVTALVGAGAALEIGRLGINHHSTSAITEAVLNPKPQHGLSKERYGAQKEVANAIFEYLWQEYNHRHRLQGILAQEEAYKQFNFEVVYHVLETLFSYDYFWSGTSRNENDRPAIVDFIQNKLHLSWQRLLEGHKSYITTIMDVINEYDQAFIQNIEATENVWYRDWWTKAKFKWDIFSLNYDTTIENSLREYEDGFEDIQGKDIMHFNPYRLLQADGHTINHMHGCLLYGLPCFKTNDRNKELDWYDSRDCYKYYSYEKALNIWNGDTLSNATFQSKESEFFSPIVTGLRKTDKILHLPLDVYRWNFERKIMENNTLVIIGYSFGDTYVNDVINRMRLYHGDSMRVVLIDHKLSASPSRVESGRNDRQAALGRALCTSFPQAGCEMILRSMNVGFYQECQFAQYKNNKPIISENGQFMCCYKGFKDAVTNHTQEIYDFLMQ